MLGKIMGYFFISGIISFSMWFIFDAFPGYHEYGWVVVVPTVLFMIYLIIVLIAPALKQKTARKIAESDSQTVQK